MPEIPSEKQNIIERELQSAGTALTQKLLGKVGGRLNGILPGGAAGAAKELTNIFFRGKGLEDDWRLRISLPDAAKFFYKGDAGIMAPLSKNGKQHGVIFPYTPNIQVTHTANYSEQKLTHSNYANYFYEGSTVQSIQISGDFTVQNQAEGKYVLAAIYFFRAATKMWFGQGANAGNPPPILYLDGFGKNYFPHVPCVITNFTHNMPSEVDYVEIETQPKVYDRVPTTSTISITVQPIYSRKRTTEFDLDKFAKGGLLDKGFI